MGIKPDMGGSVMARIQVLPLMEETVGGCCRTEFLLVFDQVAEGEFDEAEGLAFLRDDVGAKAVVVTPYVLDVA